MAVDFHSHILPGIDDGAQNIEMSVKMLEMEAKQGISHIVATPHFYLSNQSLDKFLSNRAVAYEKFLPHANSFGIDVTMGSEVYYHPSLLDLDLSKLCIGNTKYMMIELPYQKLTGNFIKSFHNFVNSLYPDILLILAHAERYLNFTDEDSLYEVLNADMVVQLNSGSFKTFSPHIKFMYELIKHDMAHLLGTDCHNFTTRAPNMEIARKSIGKKISPDCFYYMMDNAESILAGEIL